MVTTAELNAKIDKLLAIVADFIMNTLEKI
jgi:hypothetical protein